MAKDKVSDESDLNNNDKLANINEYKAKILKGPDQGTQENIAGTLILPEEKYISMIRENIIFLHSIDLEKSILDEFIKDAISYDIKIQQENPGAIYFLWEDNQDKRIIWQVASKIYFDFCHKQNAAWAYEIIDLLLQRKIPTEIVRFYAETRNWWASELLIIQNTYKSHKEHTSVLPRFMVEMCKELDALWSANVGEAISICLLESDDDTTVQEMQSYFEENWTLSNFWEEKSEEY